MEQQTPAQRIQQRYHSQTLMIWVAYLGYLAIAAGLLLIVRNGNLERLEGFTDNILVGLGGAALTFLMFQFIVERRDQERDMIRALRQMRSLANDIAIGAVEELRESNLLVDGSLRGANLREANLQGAHLENASLREVDLRRANLRGAHLYDSCLAGANLWTADLRDARLAGADLQEAFLQFTKFKKASLLLADLTEANMREARLKRASLLLANLRGADMEGARLQGTDMKGTNLQGANLKDARFDEKTILPDATHWTSDIDMTRFTDPNHPEFWRSDDPRSPAYRSDT
jgi:uncharacterized protein YjbI with pentapeptide repeats